MKVLVIGAGQIGKAIHEIVKPFHDVGIRDVEEDNAVRNPEILHICYPDNLYFVSETRKYISKYKPSLTIIHSSVAVGKTAQCGEDVVHCPVRGRHPNLAKEIPAFTLFVGGASKDTVNKACKYLHGCGLIVKPVDDERATELCKLLSNVHMGLEIAWRQEVERMLKHFGVDSTTYESWEESYNFGYRVTGDEHLTRPTLKPDPIGGHCILDCVDILGKQFHSKLFEFIKESNGLAKREIPEESTSCSGYAVNKR